MSEDGKRKHSSRPRWQYALAIAVSLALCGIIGGSVILTTVRNVLLESNSTLVSGVEAREKIELMLDMRLPFEADNMEFYKTGWQDSLFYVRFSAPPATVDLALAQAGNLCFTLPLEANGTRPFTGNNSGQAWWTLDTAQTYLSGSCGENPYYHVLVDTTNPDLWTVYLHWIYLS